MPPLQGSFFTLSELATLKCAITTFTSESQDLSKAVEV